MYKLIQSVVTKEINMVLHIERNTFIPFDIGNTDYQNFKKDLANGVALNDAEGNAMTSEQITTFLETLA